MTKTNVPEMPPIQRLHHWAYKCRDAEETRHFYEDILGLPLVHVIKADNVPSTGEYCPYVHIFFRMQDGSYVAFFDLGDDQGADPSPNTPAWVNHMALHMDSVEEVERAKARLEAAGVDVIGVTDHKFIKSIYFFDPNGYRLELTHELAREEADYIAKKHAAAHGELSAWTEEKARRRAEKRAA
jgi:glyoxylase I family protein